MSDKVKLDTLTQSVRFMTGVAPKAVVRFGLGTVLTLEDVANDPAAAILQAKVGHGIDVIGTGIKSIAGSTASKISSKFEAANTKEAKLNRAQAREDLGNKLIRLPFVGKTVSFVKTAGEEIKEAWDECGVAEVEIESDGIDINELVECPLCHEPVKKYFAHFCAVSHGPADYMGNLVTVIEVDQDLCCNCQIEGCTFYVDGALPENCMQREEYEEPERDPDCDTINESRGFGSMGFGE